MYHQQVQFGKGLLEGIAVGHGNKGIAADHQECLELLRNALGHQRYHTVRCFAAPEIEEQGIAVRAERIAATKAESWVAETGCRAGYPAARDIDVARNRL